MKQSSAPCTSVSQAQIGDAPVEIVQNSQDATFTIVVWRIQGRLRLRVVAEEIGRFVTVDELCRALRVRFNARDARRLWPPNQSRDAA